MRHNENVSAAFSARWVVEEFSHSLSLEPTAVGAVRSAVASVKPRGATHLYGVHVTSRRWLSFFR